VAAFKGHRDKTFTLLLGDTRVEVRPYYHCSHCHRGHFPGDAALGLTGRRISSGAEEVVTLGGTLTGFGIIGPGRSGGLLPQSSHRSGLAQLRHPARHDVVPALTWLRRPSIDSQVRFDALGEFPDDGPTTRHPLLSTGSRRACSPASTILRDAPTPDRPSRRASFPSRGDTTRASLVRPRRPWTQGRGSSWSWSSGSPSGLDGWRRSGLPSSRETLVTIRPVLRPRCDQAGSMGPGVSCLTRPPPLTTTKAHHDD